MAFPVLRLAYDYNNLRKATEEMLQAFMTLNYALKDRLDELRPDLWTLAQEGRADPDLVRRIEEARKEVDQSKVFDLYRAMQEMVRDGFR